MTCPGTCAHTAATFIDFSREPVDRKWTLPCAPKEMHTVINGIAFGGDLFSFRGFVLYTFSPFALISINETAKCPLIFPRLLVLVLKVGDTITRRDGSKGSFHKPLEHKLSRRRSFLLEGTAIPL